MRKSYPDEGVAKVNFKAIPKSMIIPTYMLAIFVIAASAFYLWLPNYIAPGQSFNQITPVGAVVGTVAVLFGLIVAFRLYRQGHRVRIESTNTIAYGLLYNSAITNKVYTLITASFGRIAALFSYNDFGFDKATYGLAQGTVSTGNVVRKVINGQTNLYVLGFVLGIIFLLVIFTL